MTRSRVRKRWTLYLVGGLLLAGVPLGCGRATAPEEKPPPAPVKWIEARQLFIEEWTDMVGTTQPSPDRAAHVSAAVEGHVVSLLQDADGKPLVEGQRVKKGEILVRLDDSVARANRDKVAADLEELKQQIKQAELTVKHDEIEVRRLEAAMKLTVGGGIPVPVTDLEKAKVVVEEDRSKVKGAELKLLAGRKQLDSLDEQLKLYTLTAPIAGRLGRMLVARGQTLAIGAPVVEILDIDEQVDLLCFVPPVVVRKLKLGQAVRLGGVDDLESKKSTGPEGRIYFINDQAEVDTGNFAVKVRFPNAQLGLRGNVTLKVRVLTAPGRAALTLPESALMEDQDPPAVIVVNDYQMKEEEGKAPVETGTARKLVAKIGVRDRVNKVVEILSVNDPEEKDRWKGNLDTAKFVFQRGQGLRNGDEIRLEAEEEEEAPAPEKKEE
jgi:multidrug efflux pump subunit AcrA (membrane-fusion protein)